MTYSLKSTLEPFVIPCLMFCIGGPKHFDLFQVHQSVNVNRLVNPTTITDKAEKIIVVQPLGKQAGGSKALTYSRLCLRPVVECGWSSNIFSAQ